MRRTLTFVKCIFPSFSRARERVGRADANRDWLDRLILAADWSNQPADCQGKQLIGSNTQLLPLPRMALPESFTKPKDEKSLQTWQSLAW